MSQLYRKCRTLGLLLPVQKRGAVDGDKFEGATVIEPIKGFYKVAVTAVTSVTAITSHRAHQGLLQGGGHRRYVSYGNHSSYRATGLPDGDH